MYGLYILLLHFHFIVELETGEDNCLLSNEPVALISFSLRILEVADVCYGLHCVPLKFKRWSSNFSPQNATVFGDRFFKEVMKKKWGHRGPGSNLTFRRGHKDTLAQRENGDKSWRKAPLFQPRREAVRRNWSSSWAPIPQSPEKINFYSLSHPDCGTLLRQP